MPRLRTPAALAAVLLLPLAAASPHLAHAAEDAPQKAENTRESTDRKDGDKAETPVPPESASASRGEVEVGGRSIAYTATAGTLLIRGADGKPNASVFYVAYAAEGGKSGPESRPVTFLYNGGPGSASLWLHMGSFGPVRIATTSPEATAPAPYRLVPNGDSLLDKTDLVFVDAVGTGFSKPVGKGQGKDFWGVDQDAAAFARFVERYITVNQRWNSPKFLIGESYGTPRSAVLSRLLAEDGVALNGVVLVSSILNYALRVPGLDEEFIDYLPSYAAIAWYHDKLSPKPADLPTFLQEVRGWARGEYAAALAQGHDLPRAQQDAVAAKIAQYTGLSAAFIENANLRVSASRFRAELLRGERRTMGRYDARFEGIDPDAGGESPADDASETGIKGAFTAAFNDYLARTLKYSSETPYVLSGPDINKDWDWKHKVPYRERPIQLPSTAGDLAEAMRQNPKLKVFSANGWFDLATPFFATEFDLSHMELDPALVKNVQFGYYPSGHMIYLNTEALKQLKADLARFYDAAVKD
jgi:carboxypeptidase C (cathepsin A)